VNAPQRRVGPGDELPRILHRALLLSHAALLPLAVDADIQRNRVLQRHDGSCRRFAGDQKCERNGKLPPHLPSVASTALKGNSIDVEKAL